MSKLQYIMQAINNLNPTAVVSAGGIDDITWHVGTPTSKSDIEAEVSRLEAEYDAQEYARNRAAEYPSQGDQNDMMYKDNKNSTTTHADAVEAVKTKWPKDNSGPV